MENMIDLDIINYEKQKCAEIEALNKLYCIKQYKGHINENVLEHVQNINLNDSDVQLKQLYVNLLPIEKIKKKLLKYELVYCSDTSNIMNGKEFTHKALYYLNRYTKKAGGFHFDDNLWICINDTNNNAIKFINTICKHYYKKNKTLAFINHIVSKLQNMVSNITISWNVIKKNNDIMKIIITAKINN